MRYGVELMQKEHILDICIDCPDYLTAEFCVLADIEGSKKDNIEYLPNCVLERIRVEL